MRAVAFALLLALLAPSLAQAEELILGMSAALSGPSRGLGIEFYRGANAWLTEVNRAGGVHGHSLKLVALDDRYDPVVAVANTRRLFTTEKAFLLFGYVGTPTTTRVLPLLERYKDEGLLLFCPFTGAEPMREGPYAPRVFHLRASYAEETHGLVDRFVAQKRTRIAVFYQIDSYGRSGWDGVRNALKDHKLKMAGEATYRRGARFEDSMKAQVELLRQAEPDAVICVGAYAACAAFIRDAREADWQVPIANLSFVGSENLLAVLHRHGEGKPRDYTTGLINSQVVPDYLHADLPAVRDYRALMTRQKDQVPRGAEKGYQPVALGYTSLEGFLSARLVVEVLKKVGRVPQRDRLRQAAESLTDIDLGVDKKVSLEANNHQALHEVWYTVVEKGQFVPLSAAGWKRFRK